MYLNEIYSEICMHKHWFELSSLNGLKQRWWMYHTISQCCFKICH